MNTGYRSTVALKKLFICLNATTHTTNTKSSTSFEDLYNYHLIHYQSRNCFFFGISTQARVANVQTFTNIMYLTQMKFDGTTEYKRHVTYLYKCCRIYNIRKNFCNLLKFFCMHIYVLCYICRAEMKRCRKKHSVNENGATQLSSSRRTGRKLPAFGRFRAHCPTRWDGST